MASIISSGTTSGTALNMSGDTSGVLQLATNGTTTALTLDASQNATFAGTLTTTGITNSGVATGARFNPTGSSVTGNGMYLPAANSLGLSTNGTNAVYIDSSQNVGIGTTSPSSLLEISGSSAGGTITSKLLNTSTSANSDSKQFIYVNSATAGDPSVLWTVGGVTSWSAGIRNSDSDKWYLSPGSSLATTPAMVVDTSGNVGIGTTSPLTKLHLQDTNAVYIQMTDSADGASRIGQNGTALTFGVDGANGTTERMRIDSSGNLLVGTTNTSESAGVGLKMLYSAVNPEFVTVQNTASSNATYVYYNTNATNNGYRFYVSANGGVNNFSGNNTNLSDERTKTNITLAENYLDKICAIPVKTFNYKDEPSGEQKTLGLIAQDVQQIAPEFVNSDGKWEAPEGESPLLSIYSTDMMFALMKSIQELKAINDTQAETINALTARIVAIETK